MADADEPIDPVARFEESYETTPPWDIGRPQDVLAALVDDGRLRGRVLDVGCGTGEHVLMAAEAGFEATGVDIAPTAIRLAEAKASERSVDARFVVGDVRDLGALGTTFDTVLDCGLFHVLDDDDRRRFVDSLAAAVTTDARYFLLCFSEEEPGDWGPRRITQDEIREAFAGAWEVESIRPAEIAITIRPELVKAWLASIRKR